VALALGGQPQQPQTHERVDEIKASLILGDTLNDIVSGTISPRSQSSLVLDGWVGSSIIRALATSIDSSFALSARLSAKRDASLRGWEIPQRGRIFSSTPLKMSSTVASLIPTRSQTNITTSARNVMTRRPLSQAEKVRMLPTLQSPLQKVT